VIEIDGSHGEGGGQLVRTAVALSALTGKPLRLHNAGASRARPGLAPQHLAAVRAVAALCDARCEGLELRAGAFTFEPRSRPAGGELRADVGTAGSATLDTHAADQVLVYLAMARGRSSVTVRTVSSHARTAMWLIPQFLAARFAVKEEGALSRISVEHGS
jgi:RNA 3'-terminal phosphate cyclase (ATP)